MLQTLTGLCPAVMMALPHHCSPCANGMLAPLLQVVSGFDLLAGADCMVETPPGLGLAVLSAPEPLHYYSLFSHTIGYDVVVSCGTHGNCLVDFTLLLSAFVMVSSQGHCTPPNLVQVSTCCQVCYVLCMSSVMPWPVIRCFCSS
jgi:hypothetical protein